MMNRSFSSRKAQYNRDKELFKINDNRQISANIWTTELTKRYDTLSGRPAETQSDYSENMNKVGRQRSK